MMNSAATNSAATNSDRDPVLVATDDAFDRIVDLLLEDTMQHGLQCAHALQQLYPDLLELQVAGLLHDIGHRLADEEGHGRFAGDLVRPVFGNVVAELIELHVPAKRYLVTVDPTYRSLLSADSVRTLELQGANMNAQEIAEFESHPLYDDAIALRNADERAKEPGREVPDVNQWLPILNALRLRSVQVS
jgi:predicted HD phosphohydrolase